MADLLALLSNAASSLGAQRTLSATAANNLQNANTPGYARQTAVLEPVAPGELVNGAYVGRGATVQTVTQARDRFVEAQLPATLGQSASSTAESDALGAVTALDPNAAGGLSSALTGFYSSLRALSQNAGDPGLRTAALGATRSLALAFNRTSQGLGGARSAVDAKLAATADAVNGEAQAVAELNEQIQRARGSAAGQPNDLLDLRQQHLDRLAELAGATQVPTSQGDVNVVLSNGVALVSGTAAAKLSTAPDAANGGHAALRITQTDGSQPTALAVAPGGTLGGLLAARDGTLATAQAQVDQLAFDVADAINAAHAGGYALDGSPGGPLLDAGTDAAGAAGRMAVAISDPSQLAAASTSAGVPGDAGNVAALVATESQALSSGRDPGATLASAISGFGNGVQRAKANADQDAAVRDHLQALRESTSGVSIDEEIVRMQQAQRGYEAISQVIQVTNQMMQTLMKIVT